MIYRLTLVQQHFFEEHTKYWLEARLSCKEIEKETAKKAINEFYNKMGKFIPNILFLDSPFCWNWEKEIENDLPIFAESLIFEKSLVESCWESLLWKLDEIASRNLKEELKRKLLQDLNEKLEMNFWLKLSKKFPQKFSWSFINALLGVEVGYQESLYSTIRGKVISKGLGFYVIEPLKEKAIRLFEHSLLSFYWIAFYEFAEKYLGCKYNLEDSNLLKMFSETARFCFLWWPFKDICVVSDRPQEIRQEGWHQIIIFRDGYLLR